MEPAYDGPRRVTGRKRSRGRYGGGRSSVPQKYRGYFRKVGYYRGRKAQANGEKKFFDTGVNGAVPLAAGSIFAESLNLVAQGAAENQRIGRKIVLTDLLIHFEMNQLTSASIAAGTDSHRIIIYLDKQTNGTAATPGDILENTNILSFRKLDNTGRFNILSDKIHRFSPNGAGTVGGVGNILPNNKHWSFYKRINVPVEFSGATGAIAEIRSNNLGVLILSSRAAANVLTGFTARIRYTDV